MIRLFEMFNASRSSSKSILARAERVVWLFLLTAVALGLAGCSGGAETDDVAPPKPAKLYQVKAVAAEREITLPAVVRAVQQAELTFSIDGVVQTLNVIEGTRVKRGQVIAKVDQRDANNLLAQAQAEYDNAQAEYLRAKRLIKEDAISQATVDSRRTSRDVAAASLNSSKKSLGDTILRAPFSGFISKVYVDRFQNVQAKEAVVVVQSQQVEAVVNLPSVMVARVPQLRAISTTMILDAAPEQEVYAQLRETSGMADASTQTFEVSFLFTPPKNLLILPGMTGSVKTTLDLSGAADTNIGGLEIPQSSILMEGSQSYVWVVNPKTKKIVKRPVSINPGFGDNITVLKGLKENETIISAGVAFFHPGMVVHPWSAKKS